MSIWAAAPHFGSRGRSRWTASTTSFLAGRGRGAQSASGDYLDLAQAAVRASQGSVTDTTGDLARAKEAVNEAYLTVCGDGFPYDFLEREGTWTTTAGSDVYTYASIATGMSITGASIREILMLTNDTFGGVTLESMDWQQLEGFSYSSQEAQEGQGTPIAWAKWASRIRLYPNPDQVYTIGAYAILAPAAMSADADLPLIPAAFSKRVIVPYAAALLLEQEGGAEAGADYERRMARHREALRDLRTAHGTAKRPTFNVVGPAAFDHLPGSGAEWGFW